VRALSSVGRATDF